MNFACFLPADAGAYAPAITKDSFPEGSRRLLSPRDANAKICVLGQEPDTGQLQTLDNYNLRNIRNRGVPYRQQWPEHRDSDLPGLCRGQRNRLLCRLGRGVKGSPRIVARSRHWYKIRHSELDADDIPTGNTREGWVPRTVRVVVRTPKNNDVRR